MLIIAAIGCSKAEAVTQRLTVTANGRHLMKEDGKPFFWMGDTNWRLYKLTEEQVTTYLQNRKAKKFNVIQGPVLVQNGWNSETTNAYGEVNDDPSNPNQAWFQHIDFIVNKADELGLYVALTVSWGDNWDIFGTPTQARNVGIWLGERYKNNTNVIWNVAGEYIIAGTGPNITNVWNELGEGLEQGSEGQNLITIHGSYQAGRQSSSVVFHDADWLDFNMIQSSQGGNSGSGADNWNLVTTDYDKSPVKPTMDTEATYEDLGGWDAFGVRRRAYWSVFAGAAGHTYGGNGVWQSYRGDGDDTAWWPSDTWDVAMDYEAAFDMKYLRRLMESRPMRKRIAGMDVLLTPGGSVPNRLQATRDSQGRYAMIYVPQTNRTFAVDTSKIAGTTVKAWWFNPTNGQATLVGQFPASGPREFTTPNSGEDWVLVLDNKAKKYPAPGKGGPLP
ncbi:MAG: glycoside hydrolase family 140 protein [Phycisphaerales bacterium]|nr:glycoside hydrolase family 140 protein [Phycisphaerales bacterium]